jgi:hypothetical protein
MPNLVKKSFGCCGIKAYKIVDDKIAVDFKELHDPLREIIISI